MACSDLSDCFCWSSMGLIFLMLCSSCCVYNFEVSVYVVFVSSVRVLAPVFTCAGGVTTSFVGRECIFGDFYAFCWGLSFCLNFDFCDSYPLLLCFG